MLERKSGSSSGGPARQALAILVGCSLLAVAATAAVTDRGVWLEETKLVPSYGDEHDHFADRVDLDGDKVILGHDERDVVPVFVEDDGWTEETLPRLTEACEITPIKNTIVAVEGDVAIVGALHVGLGDWCGSEEWTDGVFVLEREDGSWSQEAFLPVDDELRRSVAMDGDTFVLAGWPSSLHVFTRTDGTWTQQATLEGPDEDAGFGRSLALEDGRLLVGAPEDEDEDGVQTGSVFVYTREEGSWTREAKLSANDAEAGPGSTPRFGHAVALDGDTALIGSPGDDSEEGEYGLQSVDIGSAYVFGHEDGEWTQLAKLTADEPAAHDEFGTAAALDRPHAVIGVPYDDEAPTPNGVGDNAGAVYVFAGADRAWIQQARLSQNDTSGGERLGASVAIDGLRLVAGAPGDDTATSPSSGSAHVFQVPGVSQTEGNQAALRGPAGPASAPSTLAGPVSP